MIRIAVIADPHVHDCAWVPEGSGLPGAVRTFMETAASTRVFNESIPAFRAALDRAAEVEAKVVLLVGDLTDDGQRPNILAALSIVEEYRERHGIRVLMTPGNHDFYALAGRPQDKSFLASDGASVMVRSAESPDAATLGTGEALAMLASLGFEPEAGELHWESPFGSDPDWSARTYTVLSPDGGTGCRMIDASYLVEPVDGLWVLAIDANVCAPRDGVSDFGDPAAFHDPTDGGWRAVIQHRAHLLPWMTDVAARAKAKGKNLVAFSHYPVLDPLGGASAEEVALFGATGLARRAPATAIAEAFAATGVPLHFSGHLHVNDTARHESTAGCFANIAVSSPVGYGAGMKIVDLDADRVEVRTEPLRQVPGHDAAFAAYRIEAERAGEAEPPASTAPDHGVFLSRHLANLVHGRYLAREWPADMLAFVQEGGVADLLTILGLPVEGAPTFPLREFVEDWYRLRKAGELSHEDIAPERLAFYRRVALQVPDIQGDDLAARFAILLRMMRAYIERPANRNFALRLPDFAVTPL